MRTDRAIDLTKGSLIGNLLSMSLPIMLSNFMQTFYNLTDVWWLGKLEGSAREAVASVGLTFPIVFFLSSFGFGFVVAGTAMVSRFKGAGECDKIKKTVGQYTFILIVFSLIFVLISIFFLGPVLRILQVPDEIYSTTRDYLRLIMIGMVFMFIFISYQGISHGMGDTKTPMKIQVISVLINVFLDPLFIFGIGFLPRSGAIGAGYATLIARVIGAAIAIYSMKKNAPELIPRWKDIAPDPPFLRNMIRLALPASIGQSVTSFGFVLLQGFVNTFGTAVITIFSIGNRMTSIFMMPAMGISNALSAIVGQNLGARDVERARKSVSIASMFVLSIMFVGATIVFLFGSQLTRFFIDDPTVINIGVRMFRVTSVASFIFSILFIFMGVFNGAGQTKATMFLNVARLWIFRIPLVLLLSGFAIKYVNGSFFEPVARWFAQPLSEHPYDALWWSMVISNTITSVMAFVIYKTDRWTRTSIEE